MAHPKRFDDDDPLLAQLRTICLALPSAQEKVSVGHPSFYTKKVFAVYGGLVKGDHASGEYAQSVLFKADSLEAPALLSDERFFYPAYYGSSGWLGLNFRVGDPDWEEVAELVDGSYRLTAGKRLIAELDAR